MALPTQRGRKKNSVDGIPLESPRERERSVHSVAVEFERKLSTLTTQLEEKVEQNITLQQQADLDLRLILDLQEENKKLFALLDEQRALSSEFQRRNESMAVGLNMMAGEILQLRSQLDSKDGGRSKGSVANAVTTVDSEQEMMMIQKISDLTHDVKKLKKKYHQAKESADSSQENVDMYEEELKKKKRSWKDAMVKESKRRKNAENEVRRLKAKVEELEFLLDQRETSDELSSSEEVEELDSVQVTAQSDAPSFENSSSTQSTSSGEGNIRGGDSIPQQPPREVKHSRSIPPLSLALEPARPSEDAASEGLLLTSDMTPDDETFEDKLRQRVEERQKILESRNKRLEFEEGLEKQRHRALSDSTKPSSLSPRQQPSPSRNAAASSPSTDTAPSSTVSQDQQKPVETPKKTNLLDRLASVFKPNPTS